MTRQHLKVIIRKDSLILVREYMIRKSISSKIKMSIVFTLLFSSTLLVIKSDGKNNSLNQKSEFDQLKLDLEYSEPIFITNDLDFNTTYNFPGNGSSVNPFIIENYYINTTGAMPSSIYITQVTVHFVIRDCFIATTSYYGIIIEDIEENISIIENNTFIGQKYNSVFCSNSSVIRGNNVYNVTSNAGINVHGGIVENNYLENCGYGIRFFSEGMIVNNTIKDCRTGLSLVLSNNTIVSDNTVQNCLTGFSTGDIFNTLITNNHIIFTRTALFTISSSYCINNTFCKNTFQFTEWESEINFESFSNISNNIFYKTDISLLYCENTTFSSNQFLDCSLILFADEHCVIEDNFFSNGGIIISDYIFEYISEYNLETNLVNGRPIKLYLNQTELHVDNIDAGQVILVNCTDSMVENLNIEDTVVGLYLLFCTNILIQNSIFTACEVGIQSIRSDFLIMKDNYLDDCLCGIADNDRRPFSFYGYLTSQTNLLILQNNSFSNCGFKFSPYYMYSTGTPGIDFQWHYELNNVTLIDNLVNGRELGYFINLKDQTIDDRKYGQIYLVNCKNVNIINQNLSFTTIGLEVFNSTWISVKNCRMNSNKIYGIYISDYSDNVTVKGNECNDNGKIGILFDHASWGTITENQCCRNWQGIALYYQSDHNLITYNLVQDNEDWGINLGAEELVGGGYVRYNIVHHNTIINNSGPLNAFFKIEPDKYQAYSSGINNTWYDAKVKKGNYWSDWNGTGVYVIEPGDGDVDLYPLNRPTWPLNNPELYVLFSLVLVIPLGVLVYKQIKKRRII